MSWLGIVDICLGVSQLAQGIFDSKMLFEIITRNLFESFVPLSVSFHELACKKSFETARMVTGPKRVC